MQYLAFNVLLNKRTGAFCIVVNIILVHGIGFVETMEYTENI